MLFIVSLSHVIITLTACVQVSFQLTLCSKCAHMQGHRQLCMFQKW